MQPYETQFTLTRDYLAECFDQSLPHGKSAKPNFILPLTLLTVGSGMLGLTDLPQIVGWVLVAFGLLELVHLRYRRAWWIARQMWGASANSEVTLTIDDEGIRTTSPFAQTSLLWPDVKKVIETDLGHILVNRAGAQQYVSKSALPVGGLKTLVDLHQT